MRLLVVEDDPLLRERLKKDLSQAGFAVDVADNGVDAEFMGQEEPYDAVVLDLGLPKRAGLEVLRNWRRVGKATPVVVLTARDAWHEKVDGIKAGAADYLGTPFHIEELIARLNAVILTGVEFRLLRYFMLHPGQILSKSQLTEHVYEFDADKDSNVIEVYINRLRQKLGKDAIATRRGQGYVFGAADR